jgi:outer membrane lipoprotein-sorting protein
MFMKTGQKNHVPVLFSPVGKPRFAAMKNRLSALLLPLALSGAFAGSLTLASAQLAPAQAQKAPTPPAAQAVDRNAVVERVSKELTAVKTVQGKFSQVDPSGVQKSGNFYINRPGKARFEYTTPEPVFIVSDGTTVSIHEPKRKSYDSGPLSETTLSLFLRSNVDLKRDGSVADVQSSNGSYFVTMVDKSGKAQGKMVLEFRASDFELLGWRQVDAGGAETRVRLSDTKRNVSLKPALFIVQAPADSRDDRR